MSFEDVENNLFSRENFDLKVRAKKGEDLSIRGESFQKGNTNKSKFEGHKSNETCRYYRKPGHVISECFKLKNKREKEEKNNQPQP